MVGGDSSATVRSVCACGIFSVFTFVLVQNCIDIRIVDILKSGNTGWSEVRYNLIKYDPIEIKSVKQRKLTYTLYVDMAGFHVDTQVDASYGRRNEGCDKGDPRMPGLIAALIV